MDGPLDISVILTTYNRAALLPRAIASVLAQEGARFELIVVDDASTDATRGYLSTLADPRIRVIASERNLGPSGARNKGLEAARAEVVAFLDSDDAYLAGRLAVPLACLAADPDLVCVLSSAVKFDRAVPREARIPALRLAAPAFEWALTADLIPVEATSMTVRRAAALAVGGFCQELRLTEDREFLIRLARKGAGRLVADLLWQKFWVDGSLSNDWAGAGSGLLAYAAQRPEYLDRFRKLGSYLATKVLVGHLRNRQPLSFWRDLVRLRAAGLIDGNIPRLVRDHREVSRYRKEMSRAPALAALTGPPESWR
ncbi:MAG TPA: glycosyltransferase family 2 protein [Xanthobacteraceae bacterium]|nr:glycosyltransferase family 2 protein [Xanthobacteraceae bacterium]